MQIEQNFRDEKNPRWGFGLRFGASHSSERSSVGLIATNTDIGLLSFLGIPQDIPTNIECIPG
jgi:hypothetical protein